MIATRAGASFRDLAREGVVHFIGVGGAGMSGLAELVARHGGRVTGCDREEGAAFPRLRDAGVDLEVGHDPAHIEGVNAVVYSPAVPVTAPELARALESGTPVLKRSKALGEWVNGRTVVAIAGTHGKTSTSAMVGDVLKAGGLDPTALVGGAVLEWGGNFLAGGDELYVVEADEFDRSFHALRPSVAVVTNMEADHLDIYGDLEGVRTAFSTFATAVPAEGRVLLCGDDHGASTLVGGLGGRAYVYGLAAGSQLRAEDVVDLPGGVRFRPVEEGVPSESITLRHPGLHSVRNALAAAGVGRWLGLDWSVIRAALEAHRGVRRRFQDRGVHGGVRLVDDYAHHPTEIEVSIGAARALSPASRLVAVFQPHLFTRTRDFAQGFGAALAGADGLWLTAIYPAREEPIDGVDGAMIAGAARAAGAPDVRYEADMTTLADQLADELAEGDLCLVMGAGSIDRLPALLEARLGSREAINA